MIKKASRASYRVLACVVGIAIVVATSSCSRNATDVARAGLLERKQVFDSLLNESLSDFADAAEAADAIELDFVLGGNVAIALTEPEGLDPTSLNYPLTAVFKMSAPDPTTLELTVVFTGRADEGGGLTGETAVAYACRQYIANVGSNVDVSDSMVDCPLQFENLSRTEITL